MTSTVYSTGYIQRVFDIDMRKDAAEYFAGKIKEMKGIDFIACSGVSGMLLGPILSYITGLPLVVVRKQIDINGGSHAQMLVEGLPKLPIKDSYKYVIIDDLVCTWRTVTYIVDEIAKKALLECNKKAEPQYVMLYNDYLRDKFHYSENIKDYEDNYTIDVKERFK